MQAVCYLAPALAPLAIKLIDKYVFNDDRPPPPPIIRIPASPHCAYCGHSAEEYVDEQTCSTCALRSSTHRSNNHRSSTKSTLRSSSTSDAYDEEKSKSCPRRSRRSSESTTESVKQFEQQYTRGNTLDILAGNLKRELVRQGKVTASPNSESERSGHRSKFKIPQTVISSGPRKHSGHKSGVDESRKSLKPSNRKSSGSKISKI